MRNRFFKVNIKSFEQVKTLFSSKKYQYAHERYQNLTEEEKTRKRKYGHERYKNLPFTEKQGRYEYRKRYYEMRKNKNLF